MNLQDISTVDLVEEILARAKNLDALQELLGGHRRIDAGPPAQPQQRLNGNGHKRPRISFFEFMEGMKGIGRPATANEIARKVTRGDAKRAHSHLTRGVLRGVIVRLGDRKPHAYQLVEKAS